MHRLTPVSFFFGTFVTHTVAALVFAQSLSACGAPQKPHKIELEAIGVDTGTSDGDHGALERASDPLKGEAAKGPPLCVTADTNDVEAMLRKMNCDAEADSEPLAPRLSVSVTTSTPEITGGGRVDLTIALHNESADRLALYMNRTGELHFDIEVYNEKGKRMNVPSGRARKPATTQVVRIVMEPNATIRVPLPWDATKKRWSETGVVSAGNLTKGKYTLIVKPGFAAGGDVSERLNPKTSIEVTP